MAKYIQLGNSIDFHNTTTEAIPHNTVVPLDACIGVAAADIPAGEVGVLHLTEVWELPADGEIAFGQQVHWDKTKALVTAKSGANTVPAGVAVTAKDGAGEGVVLVRISP